MRAGFKILAKHLPAPLVPVEDVIRAAGLGDEAISAAFRGGLRSIPVSPDVLPEFLAKLITKITNNDDEVLSSVAAVIFAQSLPVLVPPGISFFSRVFSQSRLSDRPCLALSGQPCAIAHFALNVAHRWLMSLPQGKEVLFLSGDRANAPEERAFFGSVMGDGVIGGLLSRDNVKHELILAYSQTQVFACEGEHSSPQEVAKFRAVNPQLIQTAIYTCLSRAGLTLDQIALIFPHTPYTGIWDTVAPLLRYPRDRIWTNYIDSTGHLNSSDSFAHYIRATDEGLLRTGELALLINPGFGGTQGCTILRVN